MMTNGMTVIEKQFMESVIRNSKRIADALEEANALKREELETRKKEQDIMADLVASINRLNQNGSDFDVYDVDDDPSSLY